MNRHDCEDDGDEEPVLPGPDSGLIPVATKVDGQSIWEEGWQDVEALVDHLQFLQELSSHTPDWDHLLKDLVLLQPLRLCEYPLNDFSDFLELEGFLNINHSTEWGVTDFLFFDESGSDTRKANLFRECVELTGRLRRYEPLRKYWPDMQDL